MKTRIKKPIPLLKSPKIRSVIKLRLQIANFATSTREI